MHFFGQRNIELWLFESRGGSEAASRNGSEAHPFHMHGHHYWLLATGNGTWDPNTSPAEYNTVNPAYRDTLTVLKGGWAALRFVVREPLCVLAGLAVWICCAVGRVGKYEHVQWYGARHCDTGSTLAVF